MVAALAWKTVDSVQHDEESALMLAFAPETLEVFFNDDKLDHLSMAEYYVLRGEYCADRNDYSGAHANFADALNELTDYIGLDLGLSRMVLLRAAMIEEHFKKYDLAEKYLRMAIKEPLPKNLPKSFRIRTLIAFGKLHGDNENYAAGVKCLDDAVALIAKKANSDKTLELKAEAYAWRGYLMLADNRLQDAVDDLGVSISLAKGSEWSYFYRGRALQLLKKYDQALPDFNKAVELNPKYALDHYRRGETLAALGEHKKAIADFLEAEKFAAADELVYLRGNNEKSCKRPLRSSAEEARKVEEAVISK